MVQTIIHIMNNSYNCRKKLCESVLFGSSGSELIIVVVFSRASRSNLLSGNQLGAILLTACSIKGPISSSSHSCESNYLSLM